MTTVDEVSSLPHLQGTQPVEFIQHLVHIAPEATDVENYIWVLVVDTVILALTLIGSFFIIGRISWNEYKGRATTTRMRLVESLIFTDVVMGITGIIGCGLQFSSTPLTIDTPTCDGIGVTMVAVIFAQHLWTFALAFSTFMILIHPLHTITSAIEKYWYWLWPIVWAISFAISVLGHALYGYGPVGGICYYQDNSGLFGELIQFIPRGIVFVSIALLYGELYIFLKRPDKIRTGHSRSHSNSSYSRMRDPWFKRRRSGKSGGPTATSDPGAWPVGGEPTIVIDSHGHRVGANSSIMGNDSLGDHSYHSTQSIEVGPNETLPPPTPKLKPRIEKRPTQKPHRHSKRVQIPEDVPPWEHVELPVFEIDGERFGGSEHTHHEHRLWRDWHGFHGRKRPHGMASPPHLATPTKELNENPLAAAGMTIYEASRVSPTAECIPLPSTIGSSASMPASVQNADEPTPPTPPRSLGSGSTVVSVTTTAVNSSASHSPQIFKDVSKELAPLGSIRGSVSEGIQEGDYSRRPPAPISPAPALDDTSRLGSVPDGTIPFRRASGLSLPLGIPQPVWYPSFTPRRGSLPSFAETAETGETSSQSSIQFKDLEKGDLNRRGEDDEDEQDHENSDNWDLMRILNDGPRDADNDPFQVQIKTSENVDYVQESMASYLNRKTALLMLWFPLGYVALFSVSLIRLIYDFAGNPPVELRALSRWMIFSQGLLDAFIYGVVEWHTKRVVRRKVRKGTFSPHHSHGHHSGGHHSGAIGSALHSLRHGHGSRSGTATNPKATDTGIHSNVQSPTASMLRDNISPSVSFIDPESSILQRMAPPWETEKQTY